MKRGIFGIIFLALVILANIALADNDPVLVNVTVTYGQTEARTILEMINEFRTGEDAWYWNSDDETKTVLKDLDPLVYDYDLEKVAMQRAAEIAIGYAHTRPNGKGCSTAIDVDYWAFGENIAAGYRSAEAVHTGWREDDDDFAGQGHRRNLLNGGFNCIGIGHVKYNGYDYWAQTLAYRSSPNTTKTSAVDSSRTVQIEVSPDMVAGVFSIETDAELEVFQSMNATNVRFAMENGWPSGNRIIYLPVNTQDEPVWQTSDTSIISLSGKEIKGLNAGQATLTTEVLGKTATSTVTVIPIDFSEAVIALEDTLIANGLERTQKIRSVTLRGKEFPSGYTVSGDRYTIPGTYTLTVTPNDNKHYTGSAKKAYTVAAPVTGDGQTDELDLLRLIRYLAGEITSLQ